MIRRRPWAVAGALILMIVLGFVMRNQVKVYRNRLAQEALSVQETLRRSLLTELQPVALKKCTLERFGEANDGGYLMCANLLDGVEAGYSYGISGYDQWGCDISTRLNVPLHQYDCFDTKAPACPGGKTTFHAECVGGSKSTVEQRLFDSIENQLTKNSDREKRVVVKMDVEGAEWDSLRLAPDDTLERIDQLAIEFHRTDEERFVKTLRRLRQFFHVAHLHYNNFSCTPEIQPFPSWAYEALLVNRRLGVVDASGAAPVRPHALDAPNHSTGADCQVP